MRRIIGIAIIIIGCISCSTFFTAGSDLNNTGVDMELLRSQGGESLAEVYYQDVGRMSKGFSGLCYGLGLGTLAISIGIGCNMYMSQED